MTKIAEQLIDKKLDEYWDAYADDYGDATPDDPKVLAKRFGGNQLLRKRAGSEMHFEFEFPSPRNAKKFADAIYKEYGSAAMTDVSKDLVAVDIEW